ncbi:MAG: type I methionyl aminopeptidase [Lentisphaeria bacterium]
MSKDKVIIYNESEIAGVRKAAQASAEVLDRLCNAVVPGMTTETVDELAKEYIKDTGGVSDFYDYCGFPGQICISLNDEVVHGIGSKDCIIQLGDVVSLDVGVKIGGYYGDNARTICAGGQPGELTAKLLTVTRDSLMAGIDQARDGNTINDIGSAVEKVARAAKFGVVRDMVGHGCGKHLHEDPEVPNYRVKGHTPRLKAGMIICIEPMITTGTWRIKVDPVNKWTCRTTDGSLSAHFEHQVLITKKEAEILTHV